MRIFGLTITRQKALPPLVPVDYNRGWLNLIHEPYAGAWQHSDRHWHNEPVTANAVVYRCITLIATDIAKMEIKLVQEDSDGIWEETDSPAYSRILKRPNDYQNHIQFIEHWLISKLNQGNTYVLKGRDNRNVINALYVLDPNRCKPLVAPDGSVYYQLSRDDLSGVYSDSITVPASEIIHDRMNALFHPLVGLSPIYAAGLSAMQSLRIQNYTVDFFGNRAMPTGILTAPGIITDAQAQRIKTEWQTNFTGKNVGKVAALGDGLKFEAMTQNAVDSQLIEQLKWGGENICTAFGMPGYKVGISPPPAYNNIEALNQEYYNGCLQIHVESIEKLLDEGIELPDKYGTEFDTDTLLRMDTATMVKACADAVGAGVMAPNEARKKLGLSPVAGGDTPYMQQQNYSLAALDKRDTQPDPFGTTAPAQLQGPADNQDGQDAQDMAQQGRAALTAFREALAHV